MQKIVIKNFKALTDVEVELNKLLLLIGEQASGKSTLAKLIYLFKMLRQDYLDAIYENLEEPDPQLFNLFRNKAFRRFYNYFGSTRHLRNDFEATYYYDSNRWITLSLYPDKGLKVFVGSNPEHEFYDNLFSNTRLQQLAQIIAENSNRQHAFERQAFQKAVDELETLVTQQFNDARFPLFIPAGRNITVNYPEQFKLNFYGNLRSDLTRHSQQSEEDIGRVESVDVYLMVSFLEYTERIKQRFSETNFSGLVSDRNNLGNSVDENLFTLFINNVNKILKGQYSQDRYGEKIYLKNDEYVHLYNASSGQQEVIRILQDLFLILLDSESAFRVIEEPEAHLYPMAQKHLMELFALMLNKTDSQVIITTHSPYILSVFNNLLFATRVADKNTTGTSIEETIPKPFWLDPNATDVYGLQGGRCKSIFDESTGLIDQNHLDEISEALGNEFDELYRVHARAFA
jgi:AAA15 family ATPase/GTPase